MLPLSLSYIKEKWHHAGFQKYLKNTGWMFFGRFFTLGISFFVGAYIARYLGPANYGLLSYVTSFVGLFGFLATFGVDGIISREIIKDHSKKDELIGTGFYIKIIGSILAIASIFIVSLFTTRDIFTLGLIWIFSLSFIPQAFNIVEIYFQSQVLSKKVVMAQITSNIISALLKLLVIFFNKGIFWLTLIYIVEAVIYGSILLFNYRKFGNHIRDWKFNKNIAKSILKDSWPLMLSFVAGYIYLRIDQVMVKNILNNESLGLFSVGVKLSEVWYLIPTIICTSLFPAILSMRKIDYSQYLKRLSNIYSLMFWLAIGVILPISLLSTSIVKILFGNSYAQSSTVLSIYVISCIPVFLWTALNQFLLSENYVKIMLFQSITVAILNIILNFILIPILDINGAALSTVISYCVGLLFYLLFKKTRGQIIMITKSILKINYA